MVDAVILCQNPRHFCTLVGESPASAKYHEFRPACTLKAPILTQFTMIVATFDGLKNRVAGLCRLRGRLSFALGIYAGFMDVVSEEGY